jgi:hypothetical protein
MPYLKRNLPAWERALRLAAGALLALAAWRLLPAGTLTAAGFGGAALLAATAVAGFCPACALAGRRLKGD